MEDESLPSACNFLKNPLSLTDLITSGTTFEINANFDEGSLNHDIYDELNLGSDEEDENDTIKTMDHAQLVSPWTKPFVELRQLMQEINPDIWKRITKVGEEGSPVVPLNARVCIRYNAYWEGEGAPFDSSFLRGSSYSFYTGRNEVLEGLEAAVRTMQRGEHAQFIISYHLLFREMGCPPRVKPKADGLFIMEVVSFNIVGDIDAEQQIPEEDRNKFPIIIDKVKEIHLKGLDFFGQGMYRNACRAFEKALDILQFCVLTSQEEEKEQRSFLLKLYTNLAVCYIKTNAPAKTCIMCKDIRQLTNNKPSCKAVFQEGRALLMLGEYAAARRLLINAQYMEPHNQDISKELKILEERYKHHKENEHKMWTKALGIVNESESEQINSKLDENLTGMEQEMLKLMHDFKVDKTQNNLKLPKGLTGKEIELVDSLTKRLDLTLTLNTLDRGSYTITKSE